MRCNFLKTIPTTAVLAGVLLAGGVSSAADVYLQAQSFDKSLPGGATVAMWGFASCTDGTFMVCDPPASTDAPGPRIDLLTTDTLTIHLKNTLSSPVSIVIPGQGGAGDPEWVMDTLARDRVRSFTHETAPSAVGTYSWSSLRPGTYLYQSGTQPSIQVPMGLYGALVVGPATGVSCPAGQAAYDDLKSCYDAEALLLFSEIDPVQNARVADAAALLGTPPTTECDDLQAWADGGTNYPCTVDYTPKYFLINGEAYDEASPPAAIAAGAPGDSVLLRLLNAGSRSRSPAIVGLDVGLVAEDSYVYPGLSYQQAEVLLAAGKTLDVLVDAPAVDATYPIYDRMLGLNNDDAPFGGALAYLQVGLGSTPPPAANLAADDLYPVTEDTALVEAAPGVLSNDDPSLSGAEVVVGPANGMLTLNADGSFTYTPNMDFSGTDGFTYSATDGTNRYAAQVVLDVSFVNDAPTAVADGPFVNTIGTDITLAAPGVLANDADPDGDPLTAVLDVGLSGLTLNADGSFTYTGGVAGSFSYHATDGVTSSAPVAVTLNVNPVANITLNVVDPLNVAIDSGYRWVVQEDATFDIDPSLPPPPSDTLATRFHKSYMPLVTQGCTGTEPECTDNPGVPMATFDQVALDPAKRYYVSVLPNDAGSGAGHTLGGAQILPGATEVTVVVNDQPIPPAQISVVLFEDNAPTNGVPDPGEPRLGGWDIFLEDAAGRYGQNGGTMSQDADGNPLRNWLPCAPPADAVGVILTCDDGTALIKNLPPGKYGVFAVPPAGTGETWTQTSTIEGTKIQDTWVMAGEPPFLVEFGAPGYHAFIGFVNPAHTTVPPGSTGSNTITGNVTMIHTARAPNVAEFDSGSYDALAHTRAWVGVNSGAGGGPNIATVQADPDGSFTIEGIPDGTHQLVIWDTYLDQIISYRTVILPGGGSVGNIPVPTWFGRHEHNVFLDYNENGVLDPGEPGLPEQAVNLRFRDATIFQSYPTDTEGFVPFDQVFPFGAWQVAEVDYTRFKPTGVTVTVDGGGDVSGGPYPGLLNPQTGSPRTDLVPAPVLLEGFQSQPGMTSLFDWGKAPYHPGENGGISGIVFNGTTRGENDPRLTVGDGWEAGIPGVTVRLYREVARDPLLGGGTALVLVDEVQTDSWDDSLPTGCQGESNLADPFIASTLMGDATRCFDGVRNFEQVQGAVFDGGYAFTDIPPGTYVVEVAPPPGYELIKEEDVNVVFGDTFATAPVPVMAGPMMVDIVPDPATIEASLAADFGIAQPPCVGALHEVPPYLSLFPSTMMEAPFAGAMRPLCDRKRVFLSDQGQAAADFHLHTKTPVAGQAYGLTSDDVAVETNQASPNYGDKWGPAFMPVAFRDFMGHQVYRGYTDGFGRYNGLVPSTFSAHIPVPSGYSPGMHQICLNDPGPIGTDAMGLPIYDPLVNPYYGNLCYTLMYMPGTTTYLDTPVLPSAAFAAAFNPVDCAFPDETPAITWTSVQGSADAPWTSGAGSTLVMEAQVNVEVPNPAYEGPLAPMPYNQPTVSRDFGFGMQEGTVTFDGVELPIVQWAEDSVKAMLPTDGFCSAISTTPGAACTTNDDCPPNMGPMGSRGTCEVSFHEGQIVVTRGDNGASTTVGVTATVSNETPIMVPDDYLTIQEAIDAADPGALILVSPGIYEELLVMWKPVRLQGSGAGRTIINAVKRPPQKLIDWQQKVQGLVDDGTVDLLPGQPNGPFQLADNPGLLWMEQGPGILVMAKNDPGDVSGNSFSAHPSRIDGFTITGADGGGGIFVNGYAHNLEVSNNVVKNNTGLLHGGIRLGHPFLGLAGPGPFGFNTNVNIHNNSIQLNGAQGDLTGAGGGLSICAGSDGYNVSDNHICGNFHQSDGGGIGHLGLSDNGLIEHNQILFNQIFNQQVTKSGGGLFIGGEPPAAGTLTLGSGDVIVNANLIQGNQAGSGHGAGARFQAVNGTDATGTPWSVTFTNNMVVDNVAGWSGGGLSLQDTIDARIVNNTVANNDSTATVGSLVVGNLSTSQPAGISAERHSLALAGALGDPNGFSDPSQFFNNIVWHNRTFTYDATVGSAHLVPVLAPASVGDCPAGADYWDLGVLGEPALGGLQLSPTYSVLTDTTGYAGSNVSGDPDFLNEYCNGARMLSAPGPMQVAAEVIEGGNFIDVRYGPLSLGWPGGAPLWDYHIGTGSAGLDNGNGAGAPSEDFDGEARPHGGGVERGADELGPGTMEFTSATFSSPGGASFTSSLLDFGNKSGLVTATVTITVYNQPVTFNSLTVSGTDFSKGADACEGNTLAPGDTCTVVIDFNAPSGNNARTGALTVDHDGIGSPQVLDLSGS